MPGNNFLKSSRLLSKKDFYQLKDNSFYCRFHYLKIVHKPNPIITSTSRVGISVSKRVGNAIVRNRIKRIIREWFRCSVIKNSSIDFLIIVSERITQNKTLKLNPELEKFLLTDLKSFESKMCS